MVELKLLLFIGLCLGTWTELYATGSGYNNDCYRVRCPKLLCHRPVIVNGKCCPVCPTIPCKDNRGIIRHSGSTWKADPCNTCTCYNGRISCKPVVCPRLTCSHPLKKPGYCCGVCPDCRAVSCPRPICSNPVTQPGRCCPICLGSCRDKHGNPRRNGEIWMRDACTKCACKFGQVLCARMPCPRLSCDRQITPTGKCCPICPVTCKYKHGNTRQNGESWKRDACTTCTCKLGQVVCAAVACAKPNCDKPFTPLGKCCPICPVTCKDKHGNTRQNGESWKRDACTTCTCKLGQVGCVVVACTKPNCDKPFTPPGKCCPICPARCTDRFGDYHDSGDTWQPGPCTFCSCDNGQKSCAFVDCAPADCDLPVTSPDICCPTCDEAPCKDEQGMKREDGAVWKENPCKTCRCKDGKVTCDVFRCPKPDCEHPVNVPGKCCATCDMARCTDRFGDYHDSGDKWQPGPCTFCSCDNGQKSCAFVDCAPADCDLPVTSPDICCPTCDEAPCKDDNGVEHSHGEKWKMNDCEGCECNDGKNVCYIQDCVEPDCDNPIKIPGQCCRTCEEAPCRDDNEVEHSHGEKWKVDDCQGCQCNDGKPVCYIQDCARPECHNPVKISGQCCRTCEEAPCRDNNGVERSHGEKWKVDDCQGCECRDRKPVCFVQDCPRPQCDNPVKIPGQCCRVCKDTGTCDDNGRMRKDGEEWQPSPCKTCTCHKGDISCTDKHCYDPPCKDPVNIPGQCCPVCPKPVTCNVGKKVGLCKPERDCKKPAKHNNPCPSVKCEQGNICCFTKKNKPPKSVCFPQPPGEECVIKSDHKTYKGQCREKSKCRKPMVACAGYDRCTGGKWCCLKKKDKPPKALCGGMKGRK